MFLCGRVGGGEESSGAGVVVRMGAGVAAGVGRWRGAGRSGGGGGASRRASAAGILAPKEGGEGAEGGSRGVSLCSA